MTNFDDLGLVEQAHVAAHVIAGVARTFRAIDHEVLADHTLTLATWFADLAHDLEQILDRQEHQP
jgi:hypothetical protein